MSENKTAIYMQVRDKNWDASMYHFKRAEHLVTELGLVLLDCCTNPIEVKKHIKEIQFAQRQMGDNLYGQAVPVAVPIPGDTND